MLIDPSRLTAVRTKHARDTIALTTGCFDILHEGHVEYLRDVKRLVGEAAVEGTLGLSVVSVLGDQKTREIKGPSRPFRGQEQRAQVVDALRCVDYTTIEPYSPGHQRESMMDIIKKLQPDLFVGDETWNSFKPCIEGMGTEVRIVNIRRINSTTDIALGIARIVEQNGGSQAILPHSAPGMEQIS